ncbi:hypothetical protein HKX48_006122 [Thoreauomyces humboldtii]|nr:hypothetical protein HKX48_006122 [Thoreauomyces humboldtii]
MNWWVEGEQIMSIFPDCTKRREMHLVHQVYSYSKGGNDEEEGQSAQTRSTQDAIQKYERRGFHLAEPLPIYANSGPSLVEAYKEKVGLQLLFMFIDVELPSPVTINPPDGGVPQDKLWNDEGYSDQLDRACSTYLDDSDSDSSSASSRASEDLLAKMAFELLPLGPESRYTAPNSHRQDSCVEQQLIRPRGAATLNPIVIVEAFVTFGPVPTVGADGVLTPVAITKTLTSTILVSGGVTLTPSPITTLLPSASTTLAVTTTSIPSSTSVAPPTSAAATTFIPPIETMDPAETPAPSASTSSRAIVAAPATTPAIASGVRNAVIAVAVIIFLMGVLTAFFLARKRNRSGKRSDPFRRPEEAGQGGLAASATLPMMRPGSGRVGPASGIFDRGYEDKSTMPPKPVAFPTGSVMRTNTSSSPRPDTLVGMVDRYNSGYPTPGSEANGMGAMAIPKGYQQRGSEGTITRDTGLDDGRQIKKSESWRLSGLSFAGVPNSAGVLAPAAEMVSSPPSSPYPGQSDSSGSLPRFSPSGLTPLESTPRFSASLPEGPAMTSNDQEEEEEEEFSYSILHGWQPQRADELLLMSGDSVAVFQVFEDGWCEGMSERSGLVGMFPLACLKDPRASAQLKDRFGTLNSRASRQTFFTDLPEDDGQMGFGQAPQRLSSMPVPRNGPS